MRFTNIIFQLSIVIICLLLWFSSISVICRNIKHFYDIRDGRILSIDYENGSQADNQRGVYINKIITERDTVYAGTQKLFEIKDNVRFRYVGKTGNKVFKVNDVTIGTKYDIWDWLSPFVLIFTSLLIIKFIHLWFQLFKTDILKKLILIVKREKE